MPPTTAVLESGSTLITWSKADTSRPGWLWPLRSRAGSRNRNRFDVRLASRTGAPGGMAGHGGSRLLAGDFRHAPLLSVRPGSGPRAALRDPAAELQTGQKPQAV